jgi:hypothetical protein
MKDARCESEAGILKGDAMERSRLIGQIESIMKEDLDEYQINALWKLFNEHDSDRQFLRDAAIAAMQGLIANCAGDMVTIDEIAIDSFRHAHALLAEEKRRMEQK